ncbi:hypothetical protein BSKO_02629 [Bryopsis sp. KO-2023]|nr:hypothetical protein BSKO_02629 [Bryopsis sp. KO-2023]
MALPEGHRLISMVDASGTEWDGELFPEGIVATGLRLTFEVRAKISCFLSAELGFLWLGFRVATGVSKALRSGLSPRATERHSALAFGLIELFIGWPRKTLVLRNEGMRYPANAYGDIPEEILSKIFKYLSAKTLATCSCVAKSWREVVGEDCFGRKVRLESAWRCKELAPKRIKKKNEGSDVIVAAMDGDLIVMGDFEGVLLVDTASGNLIAKDRTGSKNCVCLCHGLVLAASHWRTILVLEMPNLHVRKSFSVACLMNAIVDCGDFVAIGGDNGHLGLWGKEEWTCQKVLNEGDANEDDRSSDILCLASNEERSLLVAGLSGGALHIWNLKSFARVRVMEGHAGEVLHVHMHGNLIIGGAEDCTVRIWNQETGSCVKTIKIDEFLSRFVVKVALNGDRFVYKTSEGNVALWDVGEERRLRTFHVGHYITALFLTSERLTVVKKNGEVLVWDFSVDLV